MRNRSRSNLELRASLQALEELGHPVDVSVADLGNTQAAGLTLKIEEVGRQSRSFSLKDGGVGYMTYLRITNRTRKAIYPLEAEFQTLHGDLLDWVEPTKINAHPRGKKPNYCYLAYKFPGGLTLSEDEVLNHILLDRGKLKPDQPYEGWLLATGPSLPADAKYGQIHELILTITGSDYKDYAQTIPFRVECSIPDAETVNSSEGTTPQDRPGIPYLAQSPIAVDSQQSPAAIPEAGSPYKDI